MAHGPLVSGERCGLWASCLNLPVAKLSLWFYVGNLDIFETIFETFAVVKLEAESEVNTTGHNTQVLNDYGIKAYTGM